MNYRRYLLAAVLGACSLPFAVASEHSAAAEGKTYTLDFASYNVPNAAESRATKQWAQEIEAATDGRVTIRFFFQEALLSGAETLRGVADGRADMGYIATAYYPAELVLTNVVGVPFVTDNAEAQARTFMDLYENNEALRQEWESLGVKVLSWTPVPPNIVALKEPIGGLEDLEGRRIRGYGYVSETLELVGVNSVGISQSEVYEALQRGLLDGTSGASLDIAVNRGYQEVAPHFIDVSYGNYAMTANIINKQTWDDMPQDIRDAINQATENYVQSYLAALEEQEVAACDKLLEAGGKVTLLDESETVKWSSEAVPQIRQLWAQHVASSKPDVDTDAFYDAYTSALAQYEADSDYVSAMERCAARQ